MHGSAALRGVDLRLAGMLPSRMMLLATIAISGWILVQPAAAGAPDFSGKWTAETAPVASASPAPGAAPAPLPRGDMGSGWGSPIAITQDAKQFVVEQTLFSRYDLQPALRFVYALDGSETRNAVMTGHATQVRISRGAWDGQTLRITTSYPSIDPASGKTFNTEVTHRLSLESPTSLVIEVTRGAALGGQATTSRTVYRKIP
jgi:hypothetical protein